jgi:hypothetical protein
VRPTASIAHPLTYKYIPNCVEIYTYRLYDIVFHIEAVGQLKKNENNISVVLSESTTSDFPNFIRSCVLHIPWIYKKINLKLIQYFIILI